MNKQSKSRDTRVPVSVTVIGRYTIRVYDEEAYNAMIAQYYGDNTGNATTEKKKSNAARPVSLPKHKARFNWTTRVSPGDYKKGA